MCTGRLMLLLGQMRQTNVSRVSDTVSRPDQSAPQLDGQRLLGLPYHPKWSRAPLAIDCVRRAQLMWIQLTFSIAVASGGEIASIIVSLSLEDLYGRSGP
jgi:hypothetical protein